MLGEFLNPFNFTCAFYCTTRLTFLVLNLQSWAVVRSDDAEDDSGLYCSEL